MFAWIIQAIKMNEDMRGRKIKVLIAKPGLDGHDMGAKVVIHALRDAGMEVIYTGLHRTIEEIVETALQEDADVIGLSIYSGAHLPLSQKLMEQLKEKELTDKVVLVGGNIPGKDIKALKDCGVTEVFPVGSKLDQIINFIKEKIGKKNEKIRF
jgi:methylmalonyl-CoA mutase C-terminal domain/subunit